ncbi:4-alpha-glucanotransferase [Spirulina sp. CCNP1310]|uniref:4-alpha-glucanotransferase n=1 Tax=Spirulina sp. CCNP1310 TaxID=3110249 RepID=UPI002B212A2F|nr:4-alpha-glucanotransferase [Spirulina sp. CCNP1310]MEA5418271.1 4-alpha-glucanotransferase [Spirulina sp. CCNP1310]
MAFPRASGILLHPTSLPGPYGIGDLGQAAYDFIDFLVASGQKLWQILPLGPTGYEHSPYTMNYSAFAGNPLLISLDRLAQEGLLNAAELEPLGDVDPERVDFEGAIAHKTRYLEQAYQQFSPSPTFAEFCQKQAWWLEDYVLFIALHEQHPGLMWYQWPPELARREPAALAAQQEALAERLTYHQFLQFQFFEQWRSLRTYANERSIQIIGDVSIYVCEHSADVWANQEIFKLDPETLAPIYRAGVPPDYFSATGQLWGNPVYDWEKMEQTDFAWWVDRFRATLLYVDLVRIDHFRGFEAYWQVPGQETTALNGEWIPAPGEAFFQTLGHRLGHLPVMAEDLGIITPEVEALRDRFDFPGMKILQFAFGEDAQNPYLPHNYNRNCVVYIGTHDNNTALGWWAEATPTERHNLAHYLGYRSPERLEGVNWRLIGMALASVANQAILTLQDLLDLDSRGRMNDPSVNGGNWRWRYRSSEQLTADLAARLRELTQRYNR